jgi:hypothetical protein
VHLRTFLRAAAAVMAVLLIACSPTQVTPPSPPVATPVTTQSPSPSPLAVASPTPSFTLAPTPSAVPLTELGGLLGSFAKGWRPTGETLIIEQPADQGGRVLSALPLDGMPPVPLVAYGQGGPADWAVRADGTALAISLLDTPTSARIAIWDAATATARWATPAQTGVLHISPLWSVDGRSIYYSAIRPPDADLGFFRVGATGLAPARVKPPEGNGGTLEGLTPDGGGLVWSRVQAGGSAEVFDPRSGRNVSFDPDSAARATSWRSAQPRALVIEGGCCAGAPAGTLHVWDDREGVARAIFGRELSADDGVSAAAWDPSGKRIVAAVWDLAVSMSGARSLVVMNEHGGERSSLPGTTDVIGLLWARGGIVFTRPGGPQSGGHGVGTEVLIVDPSGGVPRQLLRGETVLRMALVSP